MWLGGQGSMDKFLKTCLCLIMLVVRKRGGGADSVTGVSGLLKMCILQKPNQTKGTGWCTVGFTRKPRARLLKQTHSIPRHGRVGRGREITWSSLNPSVFSALTSKLTGP